MTHSLKRDKSDSIQPNNNKNVEDYMVFLAKSLFLKQVAFAEKNRKIKINSFLKKHGFIIGSKVILS